MTPPPRRLAIIPIALLIHNIEEALTIDAYLPRMRDAWAAHLGTPPFPSAHAYLVALVVLTIAAFALLLMARWWKPAAYALLALQAVMAFNVITHIAGAVAIGGYAPGLITAL